MKGRIFTVPNQLTFLRLAFLPFFIIAIKYDNYVVAMAIFVIAGFSDALDGFLARSLNQKTPIGAYLDPIADKLLLSSSYFVLALKGKIGWWLAILVLGRDVLLLIASAVILIVVGYRPFPPSVWGKAATFFELSMVFLVLLLAVWDNHLIWDRADDLLGLRRSAGGDFRSSLQHYRFAAVARGGLTSRFGLN